MSVRELPGPVTFEVITRTEGGKYRERSLFTMDEATGLFMAESPYGTFSYYWSPANRGENLYQFIAGLDFDYFMGKAAKQDYRELDIERTLAGYRRDVIQERRQWSSLTKEQAREVWDALRALEAENPLSRDGFMHYWHQNDTLSEWRYGIDVTYGERDSWCARFFFETILKTLIESEAYQARRASTLHERKAAA